jgi:steroid 5-alpha reductase family enzyme
MTLKGPVDFPPLSAIFGGCMLQISTLAYVWSTYSPLKNCIADISVCWSDPWSRILLVHLGVISLVWLYSLRTIPSTGTSDPSIVDRLWSNLPYIYTWSFVFVLPSPRLYIMAVCATCWGVRLTTNFVLKGGFSGGEDYRWIEVRKMFEGAPWYFHFEVFNLFFVVGFQLLVVLAFTSPAVLTLYDAAPLRGLDVVATLLFAIFFAIETIADAQMMAYQNEKYRRIKAGEPAGEYARGFIETGLWAYSRHPNYFGELGMWWAFYLFGVAASGSWFNWTLVGCVFLNLLVGSPNTDARAPPTDHRCAQIHPLTPSRPNMCTSSSPPRRPSTSPRPSPRGSTPPFQSISRASLNSSLGSRRVARRSSKHDHKRRARL